MTVTRTQLATGTGTTTSVTTSSWSAQASGDLLVLTTCADDYATGNPSGWTPIYKTGSGSYHGANMWVKNSNGTETSVTYPVDTAVQSAYVVTAYSGVDASATPVSNGQTQNSSTKTYTTPAVTPASGARFAVGAMFMSSAIETMTTMGTWLNSFTELSDYTSGATSPSFGIGVATYEWTASGASISTGSTEEGEPTPQCETGIIAVWPVSGGTPQTMTGSAGTIATSGVAGLIETEGAVIIDSASAVITASRSPSVTFGIAAAEDDVVILWPSATTASQTITEPSGWTNVLGAGVDVETAVHELCCVYYRVSAGEVGQTTWTATNLYDSAVTGTVQGALIRGVSTTAAIAGTGTISAG